MRCLSQRMKTYLVRRARQEEGQAMVESAVVIPLMVFLILGIIQLVMMQHAKIMTEYAAFNAARAGVVWNADRIIMENAAIISLMPTYEGLFEQSDLGNPLQMLTRIAQRAALYQKNRRLPQAIDLVKNGTDAIIGALPLSTSQQKQIGQQKDALLKQAEKQADKGLQQAITGFLGPDDDRMVSVQIINPTPKDFGTRGREIPFDDFKHRKQTRLTIKVQYLYMMRVPFANWVIHQAWLAGAAGKQLYGAIWRPTGEKGSTGFSRKAKGIKGLKFKKPLYKKLAGISTQGIYMVPLTASYTMRMQSNPYKQSLEVL